MSFCEYEPDRMSSGVFVCRVCRIPASRVRKYGVSGPPPRHCPKGTTILEDVEKALRELAKHYNKAPKTTKGLSVRCLNTFFAWYSNGCGVRDREERELALKLCQECAVDQYDFKNDLCKCTGCSGKSNELTCSLRVVLITECCSAYRW